MYKMVYLCPSVLHLNASFGILLLLLLLRRFKIEHKIVPCARLSLHDRL